MNIFEHNGGDTTTLERHPVGAEGNNEKMEKAMEAVLASKNFDEFLSSLAILEKESEPGSEYYKDAKFCINLINGLILKGKWQDDLSFRYIENSQIKDKIVKLQLSYRFETARSIDDLKSIIKDNEGIGGKDAEYNISKIDDAVVVNGTSYSGDIMESISNDCGFKDSLVRILATMPKVKPTSNNAAISFGPTSVEEKSLEDSNAQVLGQESPVEKGSVWRKFFGLK